MFCDLDIYIRVHQPLYFLVFLTVLLSFPHKKMDTENNWELFREVSRKMATTRRPDFELLQQIASLNLRHQIDLICFALEGADVERLEYVLKACPLAVSSNLWHYAHGTPLLGKVFYFCDDNTDTHKAVELLLSLGYPYINGDSPYNHPSRYWLDDLLPETLVLLFDLGMDPSYYDPINRTYLFVNVALNLGWEKANIVLDYDPQVFFGDNKNSFFHSLFCRSERIPVEIVLRLMKNGCRLTELDFRPMYRIPLVRMDSPTFQLILSIQVTLMFLDPKRSPLKRDIVRELHKFLRPVKGLTFL